MPGRIETSKRLGIGQGLWRQEPEALPCQGFENKEIIMYRVYSGPPGIKRLSSEEKARCLYQEFGFIDEALDFAAQVTRKGRVAILIEGDNGIELNFAEIADAMDGDDKLAAARAVH